MAALGVTQIKSTVRSVVFTASSPGGAGNNADINRAFLQTFNPVPQDLILRAFTPGFFATDAAAQAAVQALEYWLTPSAGSFKDCFFFLFGGFDAAGATLQLLSGADSDSVLVKIKAPHTLPE